MKYVLCLLELAANRRDKTKAEKMLLYQKVGDREVPTNILGVQWRRRAYLTRGLKKIFQKRFI